jgi:hypothetical protein
LQTDVTDPFPIFLAGGDHECVVFLALFENLVKASYCEDFEIL